jgi:hypothetical protein
MSRTRSLLLPLAGLSLLLVGALTPTPPARVTAPVPIYPVHADADAERILEQAVAALAPERLRWLRMNLWQQGNLAALIYRAEGVYLAGPDHRLRLDLQVHAGGAASRLQVVSDGQTLWQIEQTSPAERTVGRVKLGAVLEALENPQITAERRAEFYRRQLFAGPGPLLQSLQPGTTFTRCQNVRWAGRDVLLLTGVRAPPRNATPWPAFLPRQCRLFLDSRTLWPHRLEWWGPVPDCTEDCLLLEVEFRDPVLGQAAAEQVFAFQPGKAPVTDLTRSWVESVQTGFPEALLP